MWISIEQSAMVLFMSLWGLSFVIGHVYVEFTNYGGPHWGIDNYRLFNYLSDFAEHWLKGVYMCQNRGHL